MGRDALAGRVKYYLLIFYLKNEIIKIIIGISFLKDNYLYVL